MRTISVFAAILAMTTSHFAFAQQTAPQTTEDGSISAYQRFLAYPHQQRGFEAMRAGDGPTAIREFELARNLAPHSVRTALDLAVAYERFDQRARARKLLEEQREYTPRDAQLLAMLKGLSNQKAAVDCGRANTPVCRAERGFAALSAGGLAEAQAELDDAAFARNKEGIALRRALIQRSIYLGDASRASRQFQALAHLTHLDDGERGQWFALLLKLGDLKAARDLQAQGGLDTPGLRLAMAQALAEHGDDAGLAAYVEHHAPVFADAQQEQHWLYLLDRVAKQRLQPLLNYRPVAPANRVLQAAMVVPRAMARGDRALAQRMLDRLPGQRFRMERFTLAVENGQFDEAESLARAIVAAPDGAAQLDPVSFRLLQAGAYPQAQHLLLEAYPFDGNAYVERLLARLAVLATEQPRLFQPADRARLSKPLPTIDQRETQVRMLVALGDCTGVRTVMADLSPDYSAAAWRSLGDCYGSDRPGLAEYAYAQAYRRQPEADTARALAYQAYAAHDFTSAMQAWQLLDPDTMRPADLRAAATTALAAGDADAALDRLQAYADKGGKTDADYWWLRAQAQRERDTAEAEAAVDKAIELGPDPRYYAFLATLQEHAGQTSQAVQSLERAQALAPDDMQLARRLGYLYLREGDTEAAVAQFERVQRVYPDDPGITRQLLYAYERLGNRTAARGYAARAIDQLDLQDMRGMGGGDMQEERFALRRMHEDLGRRWRFLADMTLGNNVTSSSNAFAPGVAYRSYVQLEAQYRFAPELTGGDANTLAAYARVFAGSGSQGDVWPVHTPMLGVGLHWKPWRRYMVVLTLEQQQPLKHGVGTRSDTMLRASASWSGSPRFSDDWHPNGSGWFAQNLYLDVAHYLRGTQTAFTVDYRVSRHQKLNGYQTIEPFVRAQFNGLDRPHGAGFGRDVRAGVGVRWNVWSGESRYDAFRHRFSVGLEWQHAFTSYLHETNVAYLTMGVQW